MANDYTTAVKLNIGQHVTSIAASGFYGCTLLSSITIPDKLTSIGYNAFINTKYYNTASNWSGDTLCIGNHLVNAKMSSSSITPPSNIKNIADGAFMSCRNISQLTIPTSVKTIGAIAFGDCVNLVDLYMRGFYTKEVVPNVANWAIGVDQGGVHIVVVYCKDGYIIVEGGNAIEINGSGSDGSDN